MHNHGDINNAQAKDFKSAIKRLFRELKGFHALILIALILAALSSILSIVAPDHLSELTDTISNGLVINQDNLALLSNKLTENINEDKLKTKIPEILTMDLSNNTMQKIMQDKSISAEDKKTLQEILTLLKTHPEDSSNMQKLKELPTTILTYLFPLSKYQGIEITTSDKIALLNIKTEDLNLSENLQKVLLPDIKIEDYTFNYAEQYQFIKVMSTMNKDMNSQILYEKLDELSENMKEFIAPSMDIDKVKNITIFLVVLYVTSALFNFIEALCMMNVSNRFAQKLRKSISLKINKLPLKFFDKHAIGDTLSRVTNDIDTIAQSMNQSLSSLVSSITLFIGTITMMFWTNWILAITAIVSSVIGFIGMLFVLSKSQKYFVARQVELGNLNGHIEEVYSGLNVVKSYNGMKLADEKFDEYNKKVQISNQKSQFLSGLMMPMMSFVGNFGYVAVCIVGALLTMNDVISFGVIVAFIMYVRLFTSPLTEIAQAFTSLQSTAAASERVFAFLDEEEMPIEKRKITLQKDEVKGNIEFDHVIFKYDGNKEPTIKDFSAKVSPGQKIAIVGPTGAGKTTMVNLLMKFYDIDSGDIKIDGVSTKDLTRENVHSLFTMVLQDTWLFQGTIKENIVYNSPKITDEEVRDICQEVGLDHFIKTLPNGYDSMISDNDSVSSGQRQLLTIARGMLEKTPFLILDEATSNVDTRTEELVQKAMDKLTEGKTSFIIAHRLSTIKNADLILVMKDGNIIEQGNHETLMKKNGFYANLYNSQFEL